MSESERLKKKVKDEKQDRPKTNPAKKEPPTSHEDPMPLEDMKYEEEENRHKHKTKKRSQSDEEKENE